MRSICIVLDGTDLATIDRLSGEIERVLKIVPGMSSALAERLSGGRYGLNIPDRQSDISTAVVTSTPSRTGRAVSSALATAPSSISGAACIRMCRRRATSRCLRTTMPTP